MTETRRGRPRKYDPETALAAATAVFHSRGYSAASLDDLAAEMKMTRPSLYNAFGDKASLYQHALDNFIEKMRAGAKAALNGQDRIVPALNAFYNSALDIYLDDDNRRGCFVFCTAPAEAASDPDVAATMSRTISEVDAALRLRFQRARDEGEIGDDKDPLLLAQIAQSVLHGLALRARAGASRAQLRRFISGAVKTLTG
jgi:AcrR family transcriptional regulator